MLHIFDKDSELIKLIDVEFEGGCKMTYEKKKLRKLNIIVITFLLISIIAQLTGYDRIGSITLVIGCLVNMIESFRK